MLATAQANIPPELRQCLDIVPSSVKPLDLTNFEKNSNPTVKFLTSPSGLATDYQVVFCGNVLEIKRIHRQVTVYIHKFPEAVEIVAAEYLQTAAGKFGLAVLYNDGDQAYLARLVHAGENLKTVHETVIPFPGSCLKVVIDDVEIVQAAASLNERMKQWCNIVVVGTLFGHAYVFYLPENPDWTPKTQPEARKLTDALFSFQRSKKFVYRVEGRHDIVKDPSEVRVTSIAYIPRSCDLLIGLSFGGIVQVGFTPTGDIAANVFQSSSPVCHLVPMLPHDDPNMNVWFCAFHGERGKTLVMVLYEGSYRVVGQENVATRDREFRKALFYPRMADQLAGKGTTAEWICAHTLVRERKADDLREQRTLEHNFTLNDSDLDISQMFFSYLDPKGTTKFGIFDLNTYYYKRLNERLIPDSTAAKQCPYIIDVAFSSPDFSKTLENITDIMVDCSFITKFQFLADDPEQQIYASGLNLNRIYVGSSTSSATLQLRSLPSQVLERIYENLPSYATRWRDAALRLLAVGLMPLPLEISASAQGGGATATSALLYGTTSYEMIMTAAILYGYTDSVVQLINATKETNWSSVRSKCEWMWSEVQRARNKVDMLNDVLFSDAAKELSVDQKRQLRQLNAVLRSAKWIYRAIQEKYIQWEKSDIVPRVLVLEVESQLAAVNHVSDFANCIRNLYTMKYLPLGERNTEERQILEDMVHERRNKLRALSRNLFIDDIVAKMQQIEPDEAFWLDQEGEEWYPPAVHNAVTPLLKATYHDRMKQEFIIYYAIDLVMAKKTLHAANKLPDMRKIIFHVTEILDDVLRIGEKEITAVFNKWHREQQLVVRENSITEPVSPSHTVMEDLETKINNLVKKAEKLTEEEEHRLKALCNKIPYGQFRFQLYLIERSRYNDVEILSVPHNVHNKHVDLYAKALPGIKQVKQYLQPLFRVNSGPTWPQEVTKKFKHFEPSNKPSISHGKRDAAGAAVPLYKRIRKQPATVEPEEVEVCQVQDTITTPERSYQHIINEATPRMNQLDDKTKEKINSILRTPTSRRARAAAAAEGQTGVEVTPEAQLFLPAPASILKTPVRRATNMSPSRGRLRWDPEFVEPSMDNTAISSATEAPESDHVEEAAESETVNNDVSQTVEEQSDLSNEDDETSDTGSSTDTGDQSEPTTQKSKSKELEREEVSQTVEEQSDGSIEDGEDIELDIGKESEPVCEDMEVQDKDLELEEQEEEPVEPQVVQAEPEDEMEKGLPSPIRLVDYSIAESTFGMTPTRATAALSKKWVDADGIERSFEQQEDEDSNEVPAKDAPVTITKTTVIVEVVESVPDTARLEKTNVVKTSKAEEPSPRRARKQKSEEPDIQQIKRARRSVSETVDVGASATELGSKPRRSARKRSLSRTEVPARRALFGKEPSEEAAEQSTSRVTRAKTPLKKPIVEEVEIAQSTGRKSPSRRARTVSKGVEEETTRTEKSPSRRSRSVSKTTEEEPKTPTRRSAKTALSTVPEEPKSAGRRARTASTGSTVEPLTPTRRSTRSKTPVLPIVPEAAPVTESATTPTRRSRSRTISTAQDDPIESKVTRSGRKAVVEPKSAAKSPARRARQTVFEEAEVDLSKKRGRPAKAAGSSLVEQFRANLAERRKGTKTAGTSSKTNDDAPASSRRSRTRSETTSETAPKEKRSPGRPRKHPIDQGTSSTT